MPADARMASREVREKLAEIEQTLKRILRSISPR